MQAGYEDEFDKLGQGVIAKPIITLGTKAAPAIAKAAPAAAKKGLGFFARHGKRLLYGLTGKGLGKAPSMEALRELKMPGAVMKTTKELTEEAAGELASPTRSPLQWLRTKATGKAPSQEAIKNLVSRRKTEQQAANELLRLTGGHLPGTAKAMVTKPIQTMGASFKSMGPGEKAFLGGYTAYELAGMRNFDEMTPEERGEYLARAAAGVPLWLGTGGLPLLPQLAAWELGGRPIEAAGGAIGKAVGGEPATEQTLTPEQAQILRQQIKGESQ